jgi:hypothetical protein
VKQLGLGAHHHHDALNHFPPGIGYYPPSTNGVFGTYFFHLLPFIEQGALFDSSLGSVAFPAPVGSLTVHYPANNNVYSQPVAIFLCPSDLSVSDGLVSINGVPFGASSYAPNAMVIAPKGPQGKTRLAEITDGTSNTLFHAEKYARCSNTTMSPPFQDGGTAWAYCMAAVFAWQAPPMNFPGKAFQPGFCVAPLAALGAPDVLGPTSIFQYQPKPNQCDPTRTSTPHTGGIQVGMVDGSVRTLSPSVSGTTWWAAATSAGGEVLSADW